jgi:hypothetical protein
MIPQKIATGCRTRYFRHAKELRYALKQFVSRIQVAEDGALMILIFLVSRAHARERLKKSQGSRPTARGRPVLTERFFSATLGTRSSAHRILFEGRGHGASARVFERRGLVGLPVIFLR